MIRLKNHIGTIDISEKYLNRLAAMTVEGCVGVSDLLAVSVKPVGQEVDITLSIAVAWDVKLSTVAEAISSKLCYAFSEKTGVPVRKIEIYTDEIK